MNSAGTDIAIFVEINQLLVMIVMSVSIAWSLFGIFHDTEEFKEIII